ncbi:MAG: twin-arginine translocase TatA/TatE family subunit [Smithellaceae bacterium]|jgi:sec-independent protein translocase protein TatA
MFGIGMSELLIILLIILIIFGVGKLPEIGSALGKGIRNFKKSVNEDNEIANKETKKEEKK